MSSAKRPRVTIAELPAGAVPAPDLKLQLRNGEVIETYACVVCLGSPVLCHAMELEKGAVIPIPLDVCAEGMKMALDELLPPFLQKNAKFVMFNPLRRAHRVYIRSLQYLGVPDHERLISLLPKQEKFAGEPASPGPEDDLDAFNFILMQQGPLTAHIERWLWTAVEARTPLRSGYMAAVLARCRRDPRGELAETVRQIMGRVVVSHAGL
jgi:hypothetical protein